jgi:predicted nucleotide-binding protein
MPFYHIRISVEGEAHDEVKTDMDEETLERQFLEPYWSGRPITISGRTIPISAIGRIRISTSDELSVGIIDRIKAEDRSSPAMFLGGPGYSWRAAARATDVTDQFITGPPASIVNPASLASKPEGTVAISADSPDTAMASINSNSVFVVTGRDSKATAALVAMLRSLGLGIIEWEHAVAKTGLPNPYVGDVVQTGLRMAKAAVVILTPDDLVLLRSDLLSDEDGVEERELRGQARPNVYYEAGIADAIGRERTVIIEIGNPKSFSDAAGRHVVRYDGSAGRRNALADRLRLAGLVIDTTGEDWLTVGDLGPALDAVTKGIAEAPTGSSPLIDTPKVLSELDAILDLYQQMCSRSKHSDLSDLREESLDLVMRSQALINQMAADSPYAAEAEKVANQAPHMRIPILVAAIRALRRELG